MRAVAGWLRRQAVLSSIGAATLGLAVAVPPLPAADPQPWWVQRQQLDEQFRIPLARVPPTANG